jgi:Mor family transcriptional regulator
MNRLKEINDEIYARWKTGENHIDLAKEYGRYGLATLIRRRAYAEEHANEPRGENNKEAHTRTWKRNEDIVLSRAAGVTYSSLAKKYGICPERVRQIWMRHLRISGDPRGLYGPRLAAKLKLQKRNHEP